MTFEMHKTFYSLLVVNIMLALMFITIVITFCEWLIRRREGRKP